MDWIDASDLSRWAETREAQALLPLLVRRLVLATAKGIRRVDFPTGEGVQTGGWDGLVETEDGSPFFPSGVSGWELSVRTNPKGKADGDYEKRTKAPLELVPAESAFVFATLRRWPGKRDWELAKRSEGRWANVRALDADDLDAWLDQVPAVEAWLASKLGKLPPGVADLSGYWPTLAATTKPSLAAALVLESREEELNAFSAWLSGDPSLRVLEADSMDEAIAFASAALEALPNEAHARWSSRSLLLDHAGDWFRSGGPRRGLLLVIRGGEAAVAQRLAREGNHVLIVRAATTIESNSVIRLRRLPTGSCVTALESMGLPKGKAARLANDTGRSFAALRGELGAVDQRASWAGELAPTLVTALLAGGWDEERQADREVISALAATSYDDFKRNILGVVSSEDPPLRMAGTAWRLTAPAEGWRRLGRYITPDDLERFRAQVEHLLGIPDPSLELDSSERWTAALHDKVPPHSSLLRESMAESLARLAVIGPSVLPNTGYSPEGFVNTIISNLLHEADSNRWASLRGVLPILAEAAPDEFLDAVESALLSRPCPLIALFEEEETLFFSSHDYTYILWALERLAWSRDYLSRAALALAALAELDPGGSLSNRPKASLREVLLPWIRNTAVDLEDRLPIVDLVVKMHPEIGFDLLLGLLPLDHDSSTSPARPRFRDWDEGAERPVYLGEHHKFVKGIGDRVVSEAIARGDKWTSVLEHIASFGPESRSSIRNEIKKWAAAQHPEKSKESVWHSLRLIVSRHRQFPKAEWAFPKKEIGEFEALLRLVAPSSAVERAKWLFDDHSPELPREEDFDYDQQRVAIDKAREKAVKTVYDEGGRDAIFTLSRACRFPDLVGHAVAKALPEDVDDALLEQSANSEDSGEESFVLGYVRCRSEELGLAWGRRCLQECQKRGWSARAISVFLCGLVPGRETWHLVDGLGGEVRERYWKHVALWTLRDPVERAIAINELLAAGRPRVAIQLVWMSKDDEVTSEQIARCLDEQLKIPNELKAIPATHELVSLFERLEAMGDLPAEQLAGLEWQYFSVLEGSRCKPRTLYAQLNTNPGHFVQLVCSVFLPSDRSSDEEVAEFEARRVLAQQAYRLLQSWPGIPGFRDNLTVDAQDLSRWVSEAREALSVADRRVIGDQSIGKMLSHAPDGHDGAWPHEAVRDLLEELRNSDIELGIEVGLFNSRGVRARDQGGEEERHLAEKYLGFSQTCVARWPRTAAMLRRIARDYRSHARREDLRWRADEL